MREHVHIICREETPEARETRLKQKREHTQSVCSEETPRAREDKKESTHKVYVVRRRQRLEKPGYSN